MARNPSKGPDRSKQARRSVPAHPIIDLSATEVVAPREAEITSEGGWEPSPDEAAIAAGPTVADVPAEPVPETASRAPSEAEMTSEGGWEPSPDETAIHAGAPAADVAVAPTFAADRPENAPKAEEPDLPPAPDLPPPPDLPLTAETIARSPEQPAAAGSTAARGAPQTEPHGVDPAVFERAPRGPGALGTIALGGIAGVAASLLLLLLLSTLDLLPGATGGDVPQRLAGVEASIRSIVEARPDAAPATDNSALQARLDAAEAEMRDAKGQVAALQAQVTAVGERLAAVPAAPAPVPAPATAGDAAGDTLAPLAADVEAVKGQLAAAQGAIAALPPNLSEQIAGLQTQIAGANDRLGTLEPQIAASTDKLGTLEPQIAASTQAGEKLAADLAATRETLAQVSQTQAQFADLAQRQDELTTGFAGLLAASKTAAENGAKIDALAGRVDAVAERQAVPDEDAVARRLALLDLADESLRDGRPFAAEAAALEQLGGADAGALLAVASAGVPPPAALAEQARVALAGLAKPAQPGSPFLQQLADSARSLVSITPVSGSGAVVPASSDDPREAFVEKLRAGDLSGALAAFDGVDAAAKAAVSSIASEASRRLAAEQNLAALRSEALAAAAKRS